MSLSIVIPVFNEGDKVINLIKNIRKAVRLRDEILIVYDFPQDSTVEPVKRLQKSDPFVKLILNHYGRGVLNAIKTGLLKSKGEAVIVTMADYSDDPATISLMVDQFNRGFDIVCASRYVKGGKKLGGPWLKSKMSQIAGISAKYLMNIPTWDLTNSFKLYRRSLLSNINIESRGGFELGMEILLKSYFLYKAKVTEVPTIWHDRTEGESRFRLISWLPYYLKWYFWGLGQRIKQII